MRKTVLIFLFALLFLPVQYAQAQDLRIVLHRMVHGTELFMSADTGILLDAFGAQQDILPLQNGRVDYDAFQEGTWGIGDHLLDGAHLGIGASAVPFEAMSFMLHPKDEAFELYTPMDGLIAIGVCTTTPRGTRFSVSELQAYVGYYAHTSARDAPLIMRLPNRNGVPLDVTVFDFGPTGEREVYSKQVPAGEAIELTLAPMPRAGAGVLVAGTGFGLLSLVLAIALLPGRRAHRDDEDQIDKPGIRNLRIFT